MNFIKCSLCFTDSKLMVLSAKQKSVTQKLLSIELEQKENEPDLICYACYSVLSEFNKFRKRIQRLRTDQENEADSSTAEDEDCVSSSSNAKEVFNEQSVKKKKGESMTRNDYNSSNVNLRTTAPSNTDTVTLDIMSVETPEEENNVDVQSKRKHSNISSEIKERDETGIDLQEKRKRQVPNDVRGVARTIRSQFNVAKEQRICRACFAICDSMKHLIQHRRTAHPEMVVFECTEPNCLEIFTDQGERSQHKLRKHPKCKTCHAKFDGSSALKRHRCRMQKFKCAKDCGERFETEEQLRKHFKRCRPGVKLNQCSFCKKMLSCAKTLKEHLKICIPARASQTKSPTDQARNALASDSNEGPSSSAKQMTVSVSGTKCTKEFSSVATLETHFSMCNVECSRKENSLPWRKDRDVAKKHETKKTANSMKEKPSSNSKDFEVKIKEEKTEIIDLLAVVDENFTEYETPSRFENQTIDATAVHTTFNSESGGSNRFSGDDVIAGHTTAGFSKSYDPRPNNVINERSRRVGPYNSGNERRDSSWNARVYRGSKKYNHDKRRGSWNHIRPRY